MVIHRDFLLGTHSQKEMWMHCVQPHICTHTDTYVLTYMDDFSGGVHTRTRTRLHERVRARRRRHTRTHAHTGDRMAAHDGHDGGTGPFCAHTRCGAALVRDARPPQQRSQRRYRCNRHTRPPARHIIMEETCAAWSVVVAGGLRGLLLPGMCMYVCVQVCVYANMCVPTEVHVCMYMCVRVCVCVHSLLLSALAVARLHS